jgi:outer membrane protein TolC
LSGCASNSQKANSERPSPNSGPKIQQTAAEQRQDIKLNIQFDWWKLLQSPQLNTLIEQGFNANPTVEEAQSTLLKLQQNELSREGYFHSAISVNDADNGQKRLLFVQDVPTLEEAKFIGETYYDLHAWQLTVGYVPELLRGHLQSTSTKSEAEQQYLQSEATYRTLADNVIACALQEASLRAQMKAIRKILAIDQSLQALERKRLIEGMATQMDVSAREQSVEFANQALIRVKGQFEQLHEVLHLLLNISADKDLPENIELDALNLTADLPLELSAALIEQRPDIRAANMEMLPANTKYQSTSNVALKNIEDTLLAIHNDAITLKAANISKQDNKASFESARKQYIASGIDYQKVLIAEQNDQLAALRVVQARVKNLGNSIVLYHALGGGWWSLDEAVKLEIDGQLSQKRLPR